MPEERGVVELPNEELVEKEQDSGFESGFETDMNSSNEVIWNEDQIIEAPPSTPPPLKTQLVHSSNPIQDFIEWFNDLPYKYDNVLGAHNGGRYSKFKI